MALTFQTIFINTFLEKITYETWCVCITEYSIPAYSPWIDFLFAERRNWPVVSEQHFKMTLEALFGKWKFLRIRNSSPLPAQIDPLAGGHTSSMLAAAGKVAHVDSKVIVAHPVDDLHLSKEFLQAVGSWWSRGYLRWSGLRLRPGLAQWKNGHVSNLYR